MHEEKSKWKVSFQSEGMRLVLFIKKKTNSKLSCRNIKKALEKGICKVNGKIETFASKKLKKNDLIIIEKNWETLISKRCLEKPLILFEDDYFIIINKNCGFICEETQLKKQFKNCFLVHRLDRDTSGVLILAKSFDIKNKMKTLFSQKKVKKTYLAIVDGKVEEEEKKIESFLKKNNKKDGKILVHSSKKGLYSLTFFKTIKRTKLYSVLLCFPITGRTHQIRVHMKEMSHPILGDYQYCNKFIYPKFLERTMLHSLQIEFMHPIYKKNIKVKARTPLEFKKFINENFNY